MSDKIVHRSLGRLMNRLKEQTCAIITAYRDYNLNGDKISKEENIQRNRELRTRFVNNEMWAYSLVGHWQETNEIERSYVISKPQFMSEQEFTDFIKDYMTIDCLLRMRVLYIQTSSIFFRKMGQLKFWVTIFP